MPVVRKRRWGAAGVGFEPGVEVGEVAVVMVVVSAAVAVEELAVGAGAAAGEAASARAGTRLGRRISPVAEEVPGAVIAAKKVLKRSSPRSFSSFNSNRSLLCSA